jgi:hypothetical protein
MIKKTLKTATPVASANRKTPRNFHIDKRNSSIAESAPGNDDDMLTTAELAAWWHVSEQWVEGLRSNGGGPEFEKLGPRCIRYVRGKAKKWLNGRTYKSTAEYGS